MSERVSVNDNGKMVTGYNPKKTMSGSTLVYIPGKGMTLITKNGPGNIRMG